MKLKNANLGFYSSSKVGVQVGLYQLDAAEVQKVDWPYYADISYLQCAINLKNQ